MHKTSDKKEKPLSKETQKLVKSNETAAICDIKYTVTNAKVGIPSEQAVEDAKDWVDNGSRL